MSLEGMAAAGILTAGLIAGGWFWHAHEVSVARQAGWDAAVAAGKQQHDKDAAEALTKERKLRDELAGKDDAARADKEKHDEAVDAAQRRMRAGTDRLRCPAASPIHDAAPVAAGPVAGGPAPVEPGADVVPTVAADILGIAGDTAELVRKYDRVVERFEACRALNNGAAAADGKIY